MTLVLPGHLAVLFNRPVKPASRWSSGSYSNYVGWFSLWAQPSTSDIELSLYPLWYRFRLLTDIWIVLRSIHFHNSDWNWPVYRSCKSAPSRSYWKGNPCINDKLEYPSLFAGIDTAEGGSPGHIPDTGQCSAGARRTACRNWCDGPACRTALSAALYSHPSSLHW